MAVGEGAGKRETSMGKLNVTDGSSRPVDFEVRLA